MRQLYCVLLLFLVPTILYSQKTRLFILAGQSNMNGFGNNKDLPKELKTFKNTYIFHGKNVADGELDGGLGLWAKLAPGYGHQFSTDGKTNTLSDKFGVELSLAKKLSQLYPNDKIAFVKYAREGTGLDSLAQGNFGSWEADFYGKNGKNQFHHYLQTLKNALENTDVDQDGKRDEIVPTAIFWMQGESDASFTEAIANEYFENLKLLMSQFRASLLNTNLPVIIGKISDSESNSLGRVWPYGELVLYGQEKFVKEDKNAAIVRSTRYYKYSDTWHYDSAGYIDLGYKFGEALETLIKKTK